MKISRPFNNKVTYTFFFNMVSNCKVHPRHMVCYTHRLFAMTKSLRAQTKVRVLPAYYHKTEAYQLVTGHISYYRVEVK